MTVKEYEEIMSQLTPTERLANHLAEVFFRKLDRLSDNLEKINDNVEKLQV